MWTGPGDRAKICLARRLTDLLSHDGCITGHLGPDITDHDIPPDFTSLGTALPLLIVVDYAKTRLRLLRRLKPACTPSRHRVRLLLLARSDGEWRTDSTLREADAPTRRPVKEAQPIELTPLIPRSRPAQDRRTAFTDAAGDLARLLPRVQIVPDHDWSALAAALQPPEDLSHPRYDNALTLQPAALVTLLQHGPEPADASQIREQDGIALPALIAAATPAQQAQIITVLACAFAAHYNTGRTNRSEHLLRTLDTALDTTPLTHQAIRSATAALPHPSHITAPLALRLTSSLAQANQQLAHDNPAAFEPDLAAALSNL
ncbi:hypothetical protein [Streptomyces sp. IBSBF 2806]|uniref:hypothetical protein n=1 Tax=Streptomyces sp. IBSBF 2806 TaxID=2903529 RepID=UPI002FDBC58F